MIIEERDYRIKPGKIGKFVSTYEQHGLPIQKELLGTFLGYFTTEIGELAQGAVLATEEGQKLSNETLELTKRITLITGQQRTGTEQLFIHVIQLFKLLLCLLALGQIDEGLDHTGQVAGGASVWRGLHQQKG